MDAKEINTVDDLIKVLKKLPPNAPIRRWDSEYCYYMHLIVCGLEDSEHRHQLGKDQMKGKVVTIL